MHKTTSVVFGDAVTHGGLERPWFSIKKRFSHGQDSWSLLICGEVTYFSAVSSLLLWPASVAECPAYPKVTGKRQPMRQPKPRQAP